MSQNFEANFSVLVMSLASSAAMNLGLVPSPEGSSVTKDKNMAKFNIDLLIIIRDKTKNNLTTEEQNFLDQVISDLQNKFIQVR